jgi:branched-chain amino acid transport system ATP-binding protein
MSYLETIGLTKKFKGITAVSDLDLSVEKGEIVGIIGPNGAGKTTLFNMISGFFPPTGGKIVFKGEDITGLRPYEVVKRGLVRTFQLSVLFSEATVLENVIAGFHLSAKAGFWGGIFNLTAARNEREEIYHKAMDLMEFMGFAKLKDVKAKQLSHGYQRTLAVAMSLATGAELILLDEPVTGMTATETKDMMGKIRKLRGDKTIILVEHDMKAMMGNADRIYALNFGRKIAEGTPGEICKNKEVIKSYLGVRSYAS